MRCLCHFLFWFASIRLACDLSGSTFISVALELHYITYETRLKMFIHMNGPMHLKAMSLLTLFVMHSCCTSYYQQLPFRPSSLLSPLQIHNMLLLGKSIRVTITRRHRRWEGAWGRGICPLEIQQIYKIW